MRKRKITYITGSRADFGIISPLLKALSTSKKFNLSLYATGMHLMPEFGNSITLIKKEFPFVKEIDVIFEGDDKYAMAKFFSDLTEKVLTELKKNKPDLVLIYGDRAEMLATATICLYLGIPMVHIHGGEQTKTVDDLARQAITKFSHLHLAATKEAAKRIKSLSEEDWRIHVVGALSLDSVLGAGLLSRKYLLKKLAIPQDRKIILVTLHPVSEEIDKAKLQMEATLKAVKKFNLFTVVIYPNADAGSRQIIEVINREKNNPNFKIFPNLDFLTFLSLEKEAAVWVGNSSAGLIEAASFKIPVVNVGHRQKGREKGKNVIDTGYGEEEITKAINRALNDRIFRAKLAKAKNPWGDGRTTSRIMKILENLDFSEKLLLK